MSEKNPDAGNLTDGVCPEWRESFLIFVETGKSFGSHLDSCKGCQSAVEKKFELQAKAMEEIGRGITELRSLSNQQIVERVNRWQNAPNVHQLTCGNDSNHVLKPKETGWIWKRVILVCPNCDYVQNWIPEVVLLAKL